MSYTIIYIFWFFLTELIWQLILYFFYNYDRETNFTFSEYKNDFFKSNPLDIFFRIPLMKELTVFVFLPFAAFYTLIFISSPLDRFINFIDKLKLNQLNKEMQNMVMQGKTPSEKQISKSEMLDRRIKNISKKLNVKTS